MFSVHEKDDARAPTLCGGDEDDKDKDNAFGNCGDDECVKWVTATNRNSLKRTTMPQTSKTTTTTTTTTKTTTTAITKTT